jgi:hypothetical protein
LNTIPQIDKENHEFYDSVFEEVEHGSLSIKDILGFSIKGSSVFIPRVPCAHVVPSGDFCMSFDEVHASSIFSLSPVYDSLIYPISSHLSRKSDIKLTESNFNLANGISLEKFITGIHAGKIIPHFSGKYQDYEPNFIKNFLEPGMPRISTLHMQLIRKYSVCKAVGGNCQKCQATSKTAQDDLKKLEYFKDSDEKTLQQLKACGGCLSMLYDLGINREALLKSNNVGSSTCALVDVLAARNLDAVYKSNCAIAKNALSYFSSNKGSEDSLETIVSGLKIMYSPEMDFAQYLDFLDSRTTRAVREITKKILEDPYASKYQERLNAKVFEFNREVQELRKSRTAKFYHAVSDIAVYGGNKYVEKQTGSLVKASKKNLSASSDWIASKFLDLHAKATGKDWTIAQIYRTQAKIEKCRTIKGNDTKTTT